MYKNATLGLVGRIVRGLLVGVLMTACGGGGSTPSGGSFNSGGGSGNGDATVYVPAGGSSWHWQLSGAVNTGYDVDIYDIDLFDIPKALVEALQAKGIRVICYFSAGSYENWREDAGAFSESSLGQPLDGWEGERWLDIRSLSVRGIMEDRLDLAVEKGCDGVEPDNVDGYTNNSGFPLTPNHQLSYNRFLAQSAHSRGLSIGLKNDLDQVAGLVDDFDFAVNEQCHQYNECESLTPFTEQNKAVFNAEYQDLWRNDAAARNILCQTSVNLGLSTLVLPLELDDSFRLACP